jgi:hypothetical protein
MKRANKKHIIEMYQKKVCEFYEITSDEFFTRHDEPNYNRKVLFCRQMFLYLCKMREIAQVEVLEYFTENGLHLKQGYVTNITTRFIMKMAEDQDYTHVINRLK